MECKKCQSKWELQSSISKSLTKCPFCGANLPDNESDNKEGPFDTSRDALIYIAKKHGVETLLGDLKSFFPDYAPFVSKQIKGLVFAVYQQGAVKILRDNISSKQADKEIAFKKAVTKLTDAFITEQAATTIILEFADALGWNITPPEVGASNSQKPEAATFLDRQKPTLPPTNSIYSRRSSSSSTIGDEILGGKLSGLEFGELNEQPIIWRVLDVRDDRALLLSENVIRVNIPYNKYCYGVTWANCKLRKWLNKDFLEAFSDQEQNQIVLTANSNDKNPKWSTEGGKQTQDKIFILSISEAISYFSEKGWVAEGGKKLWEIDDKFNSARIAKYNKRPAWWWLRSPGWKPTHAAYVWSNGEIDFFGAELDNENDAGGIRPALWVYL